MRERRQASKVVRRTAEFRRVEALPRRVTFQDHSAMLTEILKQPAGEQLLRSNQAWALYEAAQMDGLLAIFPVGEGKTILSFLLAAVWGADRYLVAMPAKALNETVKFKLPEMRKHWVFPEPTLISYEKLARSEYSEYFNEQKFKHIVFDEVHKIRRKNSVRRRLARYLNDFPDTCFGGLSGSIAEDSVHDYGHIFEFALGEHSPLPRTWSDLDDWAGAIDDQDDASEKVDPGALELFCASGESVRDGYRRRVLETRGVCVAMTPTSIRASIIIRETFPKVPAKVEAALRSMRKIWETPGGEVITTGLEFARHAKELALGFYYRWVWPKGKPDYEWLEARRAWRAYVRHIVRYSGRSSAPYDTEKQVRDACAQGLLFPPENEFENWCAVSDRAEPRAECVWVSDFMVKEGLRWLKHADKQVGKDKALAGILWVGHKALLEAFSKHGVPVYGGGDDGILEEKRSCVASLDAHGEAKNLQHQFSQMCYFTVRSSGQKWEQSLGRAHRTGQEADEVVVDVPLHTIERWEAFEKARARAKYQQETTGLPQKLCYAQVDTRTPDEIDQLKASKSALWQKEIDD